MVAYLERVELFCKANRVRDNSKVAVFLTVIGASNYVLLQKLVAPEKPANRSLDKLMETIRSHYKLKKLPVAERFNFHRWWQMATESVAQYVTELRKLATHCKLEEHLQETLRDRLVLEEEVVKYPLHHMKAAHH